MMIWRPWGLIERPRPLLVPRVPEAVRQCRAVSILVIAIALLAGTVVAAAPQGAKPVTIGVLSGQSREWRHASFEAFRQGLRELGWEDGKNLAIEERFADGDAARLPALAEELVGRPVALVLATTSVATRAALRATK